MESNLSQVIDITEKTAKYDESIKEILADKQILARILKHTLDEFKDTDIETIISNISEPEISTRRLEPGHTNTEKIQKSSEEDNVLGEGKIFFDIRFSVYCGDDLIKILINIEAQRSSNAARLGYHIDNRILYYLGRMISAQKEVEFFKSDYDNLKPVRSIWICMDSGDEEDSINRIKLSQDTIYGKDMLLPNIDKVQGIVIRLRSNINVKESQNLLIAMLEELLGKETAEEKKKKLSEKFGLEMNIDTERRLNQMCNLSEVILEQGIE
nr:Rpn family recombination-promoting nuclease/putative transposase [Butyrivibrio sp.]